MGRFLLMRLVHHLALVFASTTLAYVVASLALDPRSRYEGRNPPPPPAVVDAQLSEYGVNDKDPLLERYARWMSGVLRGDFGRTVTGGSINDELWSRALISLRLLVIGWFIGAVIGVLVGVVSAVKQHSLTDRFFTAVSFFFIATPVFFTAVLLKSGALQVNEGRSRSPSPGSDPRPARPPLAASCRRGSSAVVHDLVRDIAQQVVEVMATGRGDGHGRSAAVRSSRDSSRAQVSSGPRGGSSARRRDRFRCQLLVRARVGRSAHAPRLEEQVEDDVDPCVALGDSGAVRIVVLLLPAEAGPGELGAGLGEVDTDLVDEVVLDDGHGSSCPSDGGASADRSPY
ncbi:ABC transporter permease [Geodermatophilus africanus]|nr:ABC transporter permease [Geodermatophilus africanus]